MSDDQQNLDGLIEMIERVAARDVEDITRALDGGRNRVTFAVASDGFCAVAEYLSRCRTTLGLGPTLIMSPLEFVLSAENLDEADIWIFGPEPAGAELSTVLTSISDQDCHAVRIMTMQDEDLERQSHGFTHFSMPWSTADERPCAALSTMAMVSALLFASDRLVEAPHGAGLVDALKDMVDDRNDFRIKLADGDTVCVLYDPQVKAVAAMLEALLADCGIGQVLAADFSKCVSRKMPFASFDAGSTVFVSLPTTETQSIWAAIEAGMPPEARIETIQCGDGGRFGNASGMLAGIGSALRLTEAARANCSRISADPSARGAPLEWNLAEFAQGITPSVRHKLQARLFHDPIHDHSLSLRKAGDQRLRDLGDASFVGIVLDYDGTMVPNFPEEERFGPPPQELTDQLSRLIGDGLLVGFATGRGQSAGRALRAVLPQSMHSRIEMGYFNGSFIRSLDVDIRDDPPSASRHVSELAKWLRTSGLLRPDADIFSSHAQVTVALDQIIDLDRFAARVKACPILAEGHMRVLRSQHTFDMVPSDTSKLAVIDRLIELSGQADGQVLAIGDSGSPLGNDREMLTVPHAISVDRVCGDSGGSWSLFGKRLRGPEALGRILEAIRVERGLASIDLARLELD